MKKTNPAVLAIIAMAAVMGLATLAVAGAAFLKYRASQERLSHPSSIPPESSPPTSSEPAAAPLPEPVDAAELEAALARFGPLDVWTAGVEDCPAALPSMEAVVTRGAPDAWGVRPVVTPRPPIPLHIGRDSERILVLLNESISEPTLTLFRQEWTAPTLDNRRIFTGGRTAGRAFLLVPGDDAILCVGDYTATSSSSVAADPSELELSQLENELALVADLVLEERRAAVGSLRRAVRAP